MMQWQFPELVLLAIPLWYALYRRKALPGETGWLMAVPLWVVFSMMSSLNRPNATI